LRISKEQGNELLESNFDGCVQDLVEGIIVDEKTRQCYIECPKRNLKKAESKPPEETTIKSDSEQPAN